MNRAGHSSLDPSLEGYSWEDEVNMQLRKKEKETSNRLLDVQGHSVPEAEVIYIYLFPFLSPVFLFVSLEDVSHSVSLPTSTLAGL